MKSTNLVIIATIALLTTPLAGCDSGHARGAERAAPPAPLPVAIAAPTIADISATYKTTATIVADAEAPILARVAGEVVEILVEEGEVVHEGQVLARLDGARLRLEMQKAKADVDRAAREYDRMTSLNERGLISSAAFDGLKYDLEALRAAYERKKLDYGYTAIKATIDGVVSSRDVKVGTQVEIGQAAFRITDTSKLVAYLKIPQTELAKFSSGHEATVAVDSAPNAKFGATIARISPTIDTTTGTFRATVYIDNRRGELAPGMFGRFTVAYEKHSDAILIPAAAIVREDSETIVYVVEDGAAVRRPVQIGIESDGLLEVLKGLVESDRIVVSGQSQLRDGSRVLANADRGALGVSG